MKGASLAPSPLSGFLSYTVISHPSVCSHHDATRQRRSLTKALTSLQN